jgi:hypothetical protein
MHELYVLLNVSPTDCVFFQNMQIVFSFRNCLSETEYRLCFLSETEYRLCFLSETECKLCFLSETECRLLFCSETEFRLCFPSSTDRRADINTPVATVISSSDRRMMSAHPSLLWPLAGTGR